MKILSFVKKIAFKNSALFFALMFCLTACEEAAPTYLGTASKAEVKLFDTAKLNEIYKLERFEKFVAKPINQKVWIDKEINAPFSNPFEPDVFKLKIIGEKYYNATVYFSIRNATNRLIFIDSFPMVDALANGIAGEGNFATLLEQERYIRDFTERFLDIANIKPKEEIPYSELERNYLIQGNLDLVKQDTGKYVFSYLRKEAGETLIAFAPSAGSALKFYEY